MKKSYFLIIFITIFTVLLTATAMPKFSQAIENNIPLAEEGYEISSELKSNENNSLDVYSSSTNETSDIPTKKSDGKYHITCASDLASISENISKYKNAKIVLDCNIDLGSFSNWTPIGTRVNPFTGTFDGQGYSIDNLKINNTNSNLEYSGLFGYVGDGAKVYNFVINSPYITTVTKYVGCVAGYSGLDSSYSEITLNNVKITVKNDTTNLFVGGIIGYSYASTVKNCRNFVTKQDNSLGINCVCNSEYKIYVGGISGYHYGRDYSLCVNESSLNVSNTNGNIYGGGIVGKMSYRINKIEKSCNSGKIHLTCTNKPCYAGGITGQNYGTINNCFNTGEIYAESSDVETKNSFDILTECVIDNNFKRNVYMYNKKVSYKIVGNSKIGGISGETFSQISNCYNNGKVSSKQNESTLEITFNLQYESQIDSVSDNSDVTYSLKYNSCTETIGNICGEGDNEYIKNCYYNSNNVVNIVKSVTYASVSGTSKKGSTGTSWIEDLESSFYRLKNNYKLNKKNSADLGCDFLFYKKDVNLQFVVEWDSYSYINRNNSAGDYILYNGTPRTILAELPITTTVDSNASVGISSDGLNSVGLDNEQDVWSTENGINNQLPIIKDMYWIYE